MYAALNSPDRYVVVRIDLPPYIRDPFVALQVDALAGGIKEHLIGAAHGRKLRNHLPCICIHYNHPSRQPPIRLRPVHPAANKQTMMGAVHRRGHGSLTFRSGRPGSEYGPLLQIDHGDLIFIRHVRVHLFRSVARFDGHGLDIRALNSDVANPPPGEFLADARLARASAFWTRGRTRARTFAYGQMSSSSHRASGMISGGSP